jgi:ATP-dependent helicase HrpA
MDRTELKRSIEMDTLYRDRPALRKLIGRWPDPPSEPSPAIRQRFWKRLQTSVSAVNQRIADIPIFNYPAALPIVHQVPTIREAIRQHQVIVITGETGSGKTTQIPKICVEAGQGRYGIIACTQPRRIAATSLARQVARELNTELGSRVGYRIRFADYSRLTNLIQFMTDGILLTEIQRDRYLNAYDTIIVDEAHERTLNIDFLLGYLKQVLPDRPDLKLIITSATIDVEKFAEAFPQRYSTSRKQWICSRPNEHLGIDSEQPAPIIRVSGRTYPVETRYRPCDEIREEQGDVTIIDLVQEAVEEILTESSRGDILVFVAGIQEIREVMDRLSHLQSEGFTVLPLFSRLSVSEQNRIFKTGSDRKIIISTNIAETSITVPGIHYVVDTGRARISQYHSRSGTQGLPVLPISQSSADQRQGRCGRIADGICIRLYSEEDYLSRPPYATPEIRRSDLAAVILQMLNMKLGDIRRFPFIDPPETAQIRAGFNTLTELGAIDERKRITPIGRQMAALPVDPRTARMILQAKEENALYPVLIIAAAISCQDPRERPEDQPTQADQKHAVFTSKDSDLLSLLNLWEHYHHTLATFQTQGKMRKYCRANFLSYRRLREWIDIHRQLTIIVTENQWPLHKPDDWDYDAIHRSILSGYLSHIACRKEKKIYRGTRNRDLLIFPGSGVYKNRFEWIVAIELIETSRLFAHRVARIDPNWLEPLAGDLCRKHWSEPHWDPKQQRVVAWEKITLFGFTIIERRKIAYGQIDRAAANNIFILEALVEGKLTCDLPFWRHNRALIDDIRELENRTRKRDLLVDDAVVTAFYQARLSGVASLNDLKQLIKRHQGDRFLFMSSADLLQRDPQSRQSLFPDQLVIGEHRCPLTYVFDPGHPSDGVTIALPWSLLYSLPLQSFDYLVPGLLQEKIYWLFKSLPKAVRKKLVPIQETADRVWEAMTAWQYTTETSKTAKPAKKDFNHDLSDTLFRLTRIDVPPAEWSRPALPDYLKMNLRLTDPTTGETIQGRDLAALQNRKTGITDNWETLIRPYTQFPITDWDFGDLLAEVPLGNGGDIQLWGYRTLCMQDGQPCSTLSRTLSEAENRSIPAVAFLLEQALGSELSWLYHELRFPSETLSRFDQLWQQSAPVPLPLLQRKLDSKRTNLPKSIHETLQQRVFGMIRRSLCGYSESPILSRSDFERRLKTLRTEIKTLGDRVVFWINQTMEQREALLTDIATRTAPVQRQFADRLLDEVNRFLPAEALEETPLEQWQHAPRILQAYRRRLEKGLDDPNWEAERHQLYEAYQPLIDNLKPTNRKTPSSACWRYRRSLWMLEEYKVSLYAQDLKTAFPISAKRLERFLAAGQTIESQ